jgi:hypothetical protein
MQSQRASAADLSGLYDEDFFAWTERNAQLLRAGEELHRRARALLAHLLVGQLQPAKHAHWRLSPVTEDAARHGHGADLHQSRSVSGRMSVYCRTDPRSGVPAAGTIKRPYAIAS